MGAGVVNKDGEHPVVLVCEHASHHIPAKFNDLGLSGAHLHSHIAWDPGAMETARNLSVVLNAPLIYSDTSRLVYDCNRPPSADDAMPSFSAGIAVPGNQDLAGPDRQRRVEDYYLPFKDLVFDFLESRQRATVLVTMHSFTPTYLDEQRSVEIGILHDSDQRLADALLDVAAGFEIARNKPYGPEDGVTHTLKEHALPRGLLNVMLEIRNDLIGTPEQCRSMADTLAGWLNSCLETLTVEPVREATR